jgi:2-dehydro-3-deoxygluconokinase
MSVGPDLVCIGEPMMEFNQQRSADGRRLYLEGFGGDTSNAAVAASRQGARVAYVTAVGQDSAGDRFMELWRQEGVDATAVARDPAYPTAIYFVSHSERGHAFIYYRAGSAASRMGVAAVPEAMIASAKFLYASGISQGISASAADAVFHAIGLARAAGAGVAYDTNYRPRLWPAARAAAVIHAAIALADIALPSLEDATALTGLLQPEAITDFYLRLGPAMVVLKLGAAGALLATAAGRVRIPPFPCTPVDGTGAGDTFCGSLLARLIAGDGAEAACRYAAAAAALKTEGYGAVTPIPRAEAVRAAMAARC